MNTCAFNHFNGAPEKTPKCICLTFGITSVLADDGIDLRRRLRPNHCFHRQPGNLFLSRLHTWQNC